MSWPWPDAEHRKIIEMSRSLARELGRVRDAGGARGVDPSHVAAVAAFVRQADTRGLEDVEQFLRLAPNSYLARYTGAAGTQIAFAAPVIGSYLPRIRELGSHEGQPLGPADQCRALEVMLGWTRRLMRTAERRAERRQGARPPRGRSGGWHRGR